MDKNGKTKFEISGSWTEKIFVKNLLNGAKDCVWTIEPTIEKKQEQYGMVKISILLNHLENNGLDPVSGKLTVAPTDSRFRSDQRLFENGLNAEADEEKTRLEVKQRAARKEKAEHQV
jgi:hypothetical protein